MTSQTKQDRCKAFYMNITTHAVQLYTGKRDYYYFFGIRKIFIGFTHDFKFMCALHSLRAQLPPYLAKGHY